VVSAAVSDNSVVARQCGENGSPNAQVAYRAMDQHHSLATTAIGVSNSPPACFHIFQIFYTSAGSCKLEPQQQIRPLNASPFTKQTLDAM